MRMRTIAAACAGLAMSAGLAPTAALSAPTRADVDEAKRQVDRLEEQLHEAERAVTTAEEELSGVEVELRRAGESLAEVQEVARAAEAAAGIASADAQEARARYEDSRRQLEATREGLGSFARRSYMYGPATGSQGLAAFEQLARTSDVTALADTLHTIEVVMADRADLVTDARQLTDATSRLSAVARDAEKLANDRAEGAEARREEAAARHAEVMALFDRVAAELDDHEAEVAAKSSDLAAGRERVQDLEEQRREAEEAARRRAAEEATRRQAPTAPGPPVPAGGGLVTVGGITVAASLGPQLQALLTAAAADGIALRGSGYRSPAATARLRIINGCPDVYDSPASSCRVPTAPPGNSMHERGLAIDFVWQGRTICYPRSAGSCRGNAAFDWLSANAGRYGLYVLSSEAWHWSTNGN